MDNSKTQLANSKQNNLDILIIEDNTIAHRVLSLQLTTICHCTIHSAYDIKTAMTHLNHPYHLILTDLQLPDGTAIPFVSEYHLLNPSVPIIAITAYTTPQQREQLIDSGVNDVLIKPVSMDILKHLLVSYVDDY